MNRQTRKILLNVATGIAIAATAAVMLMPATAGAQDQPSIGFGFGVGPNGPSVQFGVNNNPPPRGRPPRPRDAEVCFFENTRLRGDSFCLEEGSSVRNLRDWADEISSFDNPDGLDVTVCTRTSFRGSCRTYTSGARSLGSLDDDIESIRVD